MKRVLFILACFTAVAFALEPMGYEEVKDLSTLEILTPSLQKRKTAKIRLKNGLEAYLISDPDADQSAAALAMEVGSWNDDPRYPGIAHFLEHLLFMGSKTYPEENSYDKQVWDNGGALNAYTAPNRTVYIFSVNNDAFPLTLDMFSHMFADPLFNPSGIARELHAVDQEHDKNIESDGSRLWMIFKETGNPGHPNALFSTGNAKTLGGIPQKEVISWYEKNYSADRAHLILYSRLPIKELKAMTARLFSLLPKSSTPLKKIEQPLLSERQEGHVIAIQPFQDIRDLSIEWELPKAYVKDIENNAHFLLGYVLGGRHQSSLYSKLKKEELIEGISSGISRASKDSAFFSINFELTPLGAEHFETVLERCFQTLNGLKNSGIPPYIFDEMKTMAKIDYEYQSRVSPYAFVSSHIAQMVNEPLETYPQKITLPTEYHAEEVSSFLTLLTPEKGAYFLTAPSQLTGIYPDLQEKWSGASYAIQKIPSQTLAAWQSLSSDPTISLPKQNPYIPNDLKLVTRESEGKMVVTPKPIKLAESDRGELFFWEDTQYQVPEVSWIFNITTPAVTETARSVVLCDLYSYALDERLAPTLAFARPASLGVSFSMSDMKLIFSVAGLSEKAPALLEETLKVAKNCTVTKEEFDLFVTSLRSQYANQGKAMPVMQAIETTRNLLYNNAPRHPEMLSALNSITYEDYLAFSASLFHEAYVEAMLIGNMVEKDARNVWKTVQNTLEYAPFPKKEHERKQILTLSSFEGPYKISSQTESLGNAAVLVIQEGPVTFPKKASHMVLGAALQEDFFDTLRTKQQTGYIAKSAAVEDEDQLYKMLFVQSTTHQPDELIARFELFLEGYVKDFEAALPEGRFEVLRSNLITKIDTPPTNLGAMASYLNTLAYTHKEDFDRPDKLIAALKDLSYEELKADTATFLSRKNSKRIAIMLEGKQPEDKAFRYEGITAETLKAEGTYISLP